MPLMPATASRPAPMRQVVIIGIRSFIFSLCAAVLPAVILGVGLAGLVRQPNAASLTPARRSPGTHGLVNHLPSISSRFS